MDFFGAQEEARRRTGLLVFYFLAAVLLIVIAVYLALLTIAHGHHGTFWRPGLFLFACCATLSLVGGGALYRMSELASGGGAAVAESLGGRKIPRETGDAAERRLLNVVDEMAIASGVPVPPVYLLEESSINAFAAGDVPNEAVIAVTRGALEQLSRDELQGVIAHEFSHVLNGDMRLNLRLMGVLFGILMLALLGRELLHGAGRIRGRNAGGAVALGLALLVIGYVGVFFGRLIKAAVSRQREFLADAAAVQFTRNPSGIGRALGKIATVGSRVGHPRAEEASHLFFGEGTDLIFGWFATHPPLEERIRRIDPSLLPDTVSAIEPSAPLDRLALAPQAFAARAGTLAAPQVAWARQLLAGLSPEMMEAVHRPQGARHVIYALLLSSEGPIATIQLEIVREVEGVEARKAVAALRQPIVEAGARARLPLVDMALPALEQMDPTLRERFLRTSDRLVRADRRLDLFEYTVQHIFVRRLGPASGKARAPLLDLREIRADCSLLLSALAAAGNRGEAVQEAFAAATALAPLAGEWQRVPREAFGLMQVDAALTRLSATPPRFKRRLVEACAAAVACDGQVTVAEGELLRAVCEALEVPMPPLL